MVPNLDLFMTLLVGHLLADFPLQTDSVYLLKTKGWYGIFPHAAIHVFVLAVLLGHPARYWPLLVAVFLVHFLIDWAKFHMPVSAKSIAFLYDQALHLVSLAVLAALGPKGGVLLPTSVLTVMALYALVPALLMFASILYEDVQMLTTENGVNMSWSRQFLELSHVLGWPLIVAVVVMQVTYGLR